MPDSWTLMNSHGVVLFYVAAHPEATMREMSLALDLTERRVAQIVGDLAEAQLIIIQRLGRRNTYSVNQQAEFRHPTLLHITLGQFEELLSRHEAGPREVLTRA